MRHGFLARMWPAYVDHDRRMRKELPFLMEHLATYADPAVFNAALGSGSTTIGLHQAGITNIVSNEIDQDFTAVARQEARERGVPLQVVSHDWGNIPPEHDGRYDAVLLLGNSLTYLSERSDQLRALESFYRILKQNGTLIVDERNYQHHFLADPSGGAFRWSGDVVYCGTDRVGVEPLQISEQCVVLEFTLRETQETATLSIYPFKERELAGLIDEVGFTGIRAYGDYKERFNPEEPEFLTYVAIKI